MARDVILLDTHALLWGALDPERRSQAARPVVQDREDRGGCASAISVWELGIKVQRGQLELPISVEELARRIEGGGIVELVPVDTTTWLRTLSLDWEHRDPADRVIVATAQLKQVPILTKDRVMHAFGQADCRW